MRLPVRFPSCRPSNSYTLAPASDRPSLAARVRIRRKRIKRPPWFPMTARRSVERCLRMFRLVTKRHRRTGLVTLLVL
jgi:hypothetical protein